MRAFLWLPLLVLLGCASARDQSGAVDVDATALPPAPFTVLDAQVVGDSLRTTLQFGGGFREHAFTLEATGAATKSLPRQQPLHILHDADGDMGRALITEEHAFDLRPFRDPGHNAIRLRLDGWPDLLDYPYAP